eukprot:jgi/Bigna1/68223/fgenesh1_pg.5_\
MAYWNSPYVLYEPVPTSSPLRLPPENKVGGRSHAQLWKTVVGIDTPRQVAFCNVLYGMRRAEGRSEREGTQLLYLEEEDSRNDRASTLHMRRALEFLKKYPEFVDEDKIQSRLREGEARMGSRGLSYRLLCRENPEILSWADEELGARLDRLSILLPNHPTPRLLHCYPRAFAYAHLSKRKFLTRLFSDRMSLCIKRMTASFDFDAVAMLPGGDGIKDEENENAGSEGAMIMRGRRLLDKMKRAEQSAEDLAELEALWGYTRLKFSKRDYMMTMMVMMKSSSHISKLKGSRHISNYQAFRAFEALSFGGNGLQIGNLYDDFSSSAAPFRIASVGGGPGSDVAGAIFWHEIVYGSRGNVKARIFDVSDTWRAISQVAADALETNVEFGHCDVSDTLFSSSANEAFLAFVRSEARMGHPWLFIFSFVLFEAGRAVWSWFATIRLRSMGHNPEIKRVPIVGRSRRRAVI